MSKNCNSTIQLKTVYRTVKTVQNYIIKYHTGQYSTTIEHLSIIVLVTERLMVPINMKE